MFQKNAQSCVDKEDSEFYEADKDVNYVYVISQILIKIIIFSCFNIQNLDL